MPSVLHPHSVACKKLIRHAMYSRGVNCKTVADAIGKDTSTLSRYLSDEHEHEMGVTSILIFEGVTGDRTVIEYLCAELGGKFVPGDAA